MKILVGNISAGAEYLLNSYIQKYAPGTDLVPLGAVGIRGKVKREAPNPEVLLVILDTTAYQECASTSSVQAVLSNPKVHKYTDDDNFKAFLISKFGVLDDDTSDALPPPDKLLGNNTIMDEDFSMGLSAGESSNDEEIERLRAELDEQKLLVRNLTQQLDDDSTQSDIINLTDEIRRLKGIIDEKESEVSEYTEKLNRAETDLEKVDELKVSLREAREANAALEFDKTSLVKELDGKEKEISDLQELLTSSSNQAAELEKELESSNARISDMEAQLTANASDAGVVEGKLKELEALKGTLEDVRDSLKAKTLECENLGVDLTKAQNEAGALKEEISTLESKLKEQESEIADKSSQLSLLTESNTSVVAELNMKLSSVKEDLKGALADLDEWKEKYSLLEGNASEQKKESDALIGSLREDIEKLEFKDSEIALLESDLQEAKKACENLNKTVSELTAESVKKDEAIRGVEEQKTLLEDSLSVKEDMMSKLLADKDEVSERAEQLELDCISLRDEIKELQDDISGKNEVITGKDNEISELNSTIKKLDNTVSSLNEKLEQKEVDTTQVAKLEKELFEQKRQLVKAQSELDVLRKASSGDSGSTAKYKSRISELEKQLTEAQNAVSDNSSSEELQELRARCTNLELDLAERDAHIEELDASIFTQLANIAMPKVAYDVKLPVASQGNRAGAYCFAGGSTESMVSLYHVMRNVCEKNQGTKYVVLDVVTDSTIDTQFGVSRVSSPVNWLNGSEPVTNFLADTRFSNVKVLSTALAYLNDMYLLGVDWDKRLNELQELADIIIVNIGCLNNLVTKVLFSTFSHIMQTYVVVKATPVNLRTVILSLTGFNSLPQGVEVVCSNFDAKSSKVMYQRLTQKYKAQILKDNDALELKGGV